MIKRCNDCRVECGAAYCEACRRWRRDAAGKVTDAESLERMQRELKRRLRALRQDLRQ